MEGEGFGASGSWSLDVGFRVFKWALRKKTAGDERGNKVHP